MKNCMEYKGYFGSIEYSDEDRCFYGKVLGIKSLILFEGTNVQELEDSFHQMLDEYLKHQEEVVRRRTQYDLNKAEERAHILKGLLIALDHIDEVIRIIRGSSNVADAKSLVIHPASTTHAQLSPEEQADQGIRPNTMRMSVGTEHIDDILQDLEEAFKAVEKCNF